MDRRSTLILSFGLISAALLAALFLMMPWRAGAGPIPTVTFTAVDMDPTGNTCGSIGSVQQTLENVPLNTPTVINVVVSGVPVGAAPEGDNGGIYGTGFELNFDPDFVRVTGGSGGANNVLHLCSGTGYVPLEVFDGPTGPGDGSFRADTVDLSGNEESGSGRLAAITIECIATGVSSLTLTDTSTGGGDFAGVIGDSGAITYTPLQELEGTIGCNTTIPTDATLLVSKDFIPNSGASVTVSVNCTNGGVAVPSSAPATEATPASFTIQNPGPTVTCTATEAVPAGYTANQTDCAGVPITSAATFNCSITNDLDPITFTVVKDFVGNSSAIVNVTLTCTSGTVTPPGTSSIGTAQIQEGSPAVFTIDDFNTGATCTLSETPEPAGYAVDYGPDCVSVLLEPGSNESCEVDNFATADVTIRKDFSDNNPMDVTIVVNCSSGFDNPTDATASESDPSEWLITSFDPDSTCTVQENPEPAGYQFSINDCGGIVINAGSVIDCTVVNLTQRTVLVSKDFSDDNPAEVTIGLICESGNITNVDAGADENDEAEFTVVGFIPGDACTATESGEPLGYVKDEGGCVSLTLTVSSAPLTCTIFNDAQSTITVTKTYTDANLTPVDVTVNCTSGLVTPSNTQSVAPGPPGVGFTVTGHDNATDCTISESGVPAGYSMDPVASTCDEGVTLTAPSSNSCTFVNEPSVTTFTVIKDYVPDLIGNAVTIQLNCTGTAVVTPIDMLASEGDPATFTVTAFSQGDTCTATETGQATGFVKDESNCLNVVLVQGATNCTITNTSETTVTIAKNFIPDNDGVSVTLQLNCPSGIVTPASDTATETPVPDNAVFTVRGFVDDTTCTVTEDPIPGWIFGTGDCVGEPLILNYGDVNFCTVTNTETSATATVSKFYTDGNQTDVTITPTCPSANVSPPSALAGPNAGSAVFTITRFPVAGINCSFAESGVPSGYAMDATLSSCDEGLTIQNGVNAACHFTNKPSTGTLLVNLDLVPNDAFPVLVSISCTGGTVVGGPAQIAVEGGNNYTVNAFNPGDTCSVTQLVPPPGYVETSNNCTNVALVNDGFAICSIVDSTQIDIIVGKDFSDDDAQDVTITITGCTSGTITSSDPTASESDPANFQLTGYSLGTSCTIGESPVPQGYIFDPGNCDEALAIIIFPGLPINCTVTNTLRTATITLPVVFDDGAPLDATVAVNCSSGTVTNFDNTASEPDPANFTLEGFEDDSFCGFTWTAPAGYHMGANCTGAVFINHGDDIVCVPASNVLLNVANFTVNKNFTDDAEDAVTIALSCTSGNEVTIDDQATELDPATFRVEGFTDPGTTCTATESGLPVGYFPDESDCLNVPISIDGNHSCEIINSDATATPRPTRTPFGQTPGPEPTASPTPTPTPAPTAPPTSSPAPTTPGPTAPPGSSTARPTRTPIGGPGPTAPPTAVPTVTPTPTPEPPTGSPTAPPSPGSPTSSPRPTRTPNPAFTSSMSTFGNLW